MKITSNASTVISGVIAAPALLLSFSPLDQADIVLGFSAVIALLAIATVECRLNWKRLLGL